jgi:hypothetical protein
MKAPAWGGEATFTAIDMMARVSIALDVPLVLAVLQ